MGASMLDEDGVTVTMSEIYVSTDVEVDGPIPGPHSMLSFGSAAYREDKTLIATFTANLELLPGAQGDPNTMAWWSERPAAWNACRNQLRPPAETMRDYVEWVEGLPGRPVFVGFPASFDFMFVYWYIMRFVGRSPFSFAALDIKTMAMILLGKEYRHCSKKNMPRRWFDDFPHSHVALDDAVEQGALFCNMLAESRRRTHLC
jgi:hypothetical protein